MPQEMPRPNLGTDPSTEGPQETNSEWLSRRHTLFARLVTEHLWGLYSLSPHVQSLQDMLVLHLDSATALMKAVRLELTAAAGEPSMQKQMLSPSVLGMDPLLMELDSILRLLHAWNAPSSSSMQEWESSSTETTTETAAD